MLPLKAYKLTIESSSSEIHSLIFPLFFREGYPAINFDWRTHGALRGSRIKEGRNVRACLRLPLVNPNQNSQFMERVTIVRLAIRCPNARKSDHPPATSDRARFALWFGAASAFSASFFLPAAGDDNSKRTILLWATNYISNHRDSSSGIRRIKLTTHQRDLEFSKIMFSLPCVSYVVPF